MPFCKSKCSYCSFVSGIYPDEVIEKYFEYLPNELSKFMFFLSPVPEITTLYFGGGTPSAVKTSVFEKAAHDILSLLPNRPEEITIETNPSDVDKNFVDVLKTVGINRVSIGAQSFNDDVLKFLGRRQTKDDIFKAYQLLRQEGFGNISIDLIHGVPGFNIKRWLSDLRLVVDLGPEHISLYALSIEEGCRFFNQDIRKKLNPDSTADEYNAAVQALRSAGYTRYEISNFAKPGFECRHNMAYWKTENYAGFGPSAAGYMDGIYTEKIADVEKYISLLEAGESTIVNQTQFDNHDQMVNSLMMGLRLEKGVNLDELENRFGINVLKFVHERFEDLFQGEYVILEDRNLRFADKGFYVSNNLLSRLF